jgi:hypothetical protein
MSGIRQHPCHAHRRGRLTEKEVEPSGHQQLRGVRSHHSAANSQLTGFAGSEETDDSTGDCKNG